MFQTIILIFVILIMIAEKFLDNKNKENNTTNEQQTTNYSDKYKKKEYLLSKNELKFYRILKQITDNLGYSLFCQVSLYQLLKSDDFKNVTDPEAYKVKISWDYTKSNDFQTSATMVIVKDGEKLSVAKLEDE